MLRTVLVHVSLFVLATLLLPSCSSDGDPCDPKVAGSCKSGQQCEAASRTCKSEERCDGDDECGGYSCRAPNGVLSTSSYCGVNCGESGDNGCAAGFKCQADLTCKPAAGQTCDPANTYGDCNGPGCDAVTRVCSDSKRCTEDAECPDGFACSAYGRCLRFCTNTQISPVQCASAFTCGDDFRCR